jgi:hypothetical protein
MCVFRVKSKQYLIKGSKGSPEQVLAEHVASKIGMIIRRATQVVAGTTMKERNTMAPQSAARGAPRSRDRAAAGMPDRTIV